MNIRLYNARIMTMEDPGVITEGEIWVNDNVISYVGNEKEKITTFKEAFYSLQEEDTYKYR